MSDSSAPALPSGVLASDSEELLRVLLNLSVSGVMLLRPLYDDTADGRPLVDFGMAHLNPAAQQMLKLPEQPAASFLTLYPTAPTAGVFDFYRNAFLSGRVERRQNNYQHDGLDGYYLLVAQRQGELLVVSFTDTNDHLRTGIEEELRRSQARELEARAEAEAQRQQLHNVLLQLPAHVALFAGPEHVFELVNTRYQQQFPERVLRGLPIRTALPELLGQQHLEVFDEVYRTGQPHHGREVETWLDVTGMGRLEQRFFNVLVMAQRDARQRVSGLVSFSYDVTEQVQARRQVQALNEEMASVNEELRVNNDELISTNAALSQSEQALHALNRALEARVAERTQQLQQQQSVLRQILGQVPAAIATLAGPEHRYTFFNHRYLELTGNRAQLGSSVAQAVPELAEQGMVQLLDRVYAGGEAVAGTEQPTSLYNPVTGRHETVYVDFIYQPLLDGQGRPAGVLAFVLDSTEKVHARQAGEVSARQLQLITDALPVLIGYLDQEQKYRFANRAYEAWFHRDPAEMLGVPIREIAGPEAYPNIEGYVRRALAGERVEFETVMPFRPDFTKYIRTTYVPDVQDGRVLGCFTLVTDVTEQTLARQRVQELNDELAVINEEILVANEELRDTNDRLIRTNVDLDTFVYTASHDLKAPIANIEGLLAALREQLPPPVGHDPQVAQLLALMQASVERFQRTLGHLTDVSKLQQAHDEPAEPVDLLALTESLRLDLAPALAAEGGLLLVDLGDCPTLRFSPKNLRSILYNLLSNALKYRDPARPPRVLLRASCKPGLMRLAVHDNGLGLSEEQQGKLFVMFRRLHTHVDGTGVGLYMVKRMVENAGGNIRVVSRPGVGSVFTVSLPNLT